MDPSQRPSRPPSQQASARAPRIHRPAQYPSIELLEPRLLLHGLTVITHGFELTTGTPAWVTNMGKAIAARMGPDTSVYKLTLTHSGNTPLVSAFSYVQGPSLFTGTSSHAETVLLIDWSADSGVGFPSPYFSTTQLATLIVPWLVNTLTSNGMTAPALAQGPVQLIGHSRGASLMSALATDLGQIGIWVDQLTPLDPVPINSDAAVVPTSNVIFADNYYETQATPHGSTVTAHYNLDLTSVDPNHSGIHAYYHGSIDFNATGDGDGTNISSSWYTSPNPARNATGFFYTRTVGGTRPLVGVATAFGGTGSRVAVTPSGTQWPDIGFLNPSTTSLQRGQPFSVSYDYQYAPSSSTVQFYLDPDQNPYDGNSIALGGTTTLPASAAVQQNIASLTAAAAPGTYYLEAVITSATQTRIAYAPAALSIAGAVSIAGAYMFYGGSSFDSANHNTALAPDKSPLLPGQTASFANYSSYSRGINGIMIDLPSPGGTLGPSDFTFKVGGNSPGSVDPSTWTHAPLALGIVMRPGAGTGGSTRVDVTWADNAIQNEWLQVTLKGGTGAASGLATDAAFYFGNAIGEAGNDPMSARVTAVDEIAARSNPSAKALLTNLYDFDRDGLVDSTDQLIARTHVTNFMNELQLISPPATQDAASGIAVATVDAGTSAAITTSATFEASRVLSPILSSPMPPVQLLTPDSHESSGALAAASDKRVVLMRSAGFNLRRRPLMLDLYRKLPLIALLHRV